VYVLVRDASAKLGFIIAQRVSCPSASTASEAQHLSNQASDRLSVGF